MPSANLAVRTTLFARLSAQAFLAIFCLISALALPACQAAETAPSVLPRQYLVTTSEDFKTMSGWDPFYNILGGFYSPDGAFYYNSAYQNVSLWTRGTSSYATNTYWFYVLANQSYYLWLGEQERFTDQIAYAVSHYYETNAIYVPAATAPGNSAPWWHYSKDLPDGYGVITSSSVDTTIDLLTGGYPNSTGDSIVKLTVSVTHYDSIDYESGDLADPVSVPDEDITILGAHPTNGVIYQSLPDNRTNDITPALSGSYSNYAFSVSAEATRLKIIFNGTDVTASSANVVVGQGIDLTCALTANFGAISNISWNIPENWVEDYFASDTNAYIVKLLINTHFANMYFYWTSGGSKTVFCSAEWNGKTLTAQAQFNVDRPVATITPSALGTVGIDTNYYLGMALHFGAGFATNAGMRLTYSADTLGQSGSFQWVQLVSELVRVKTNNAGNAGWLRSEGAGLDTTYPYSLVSGASAYDSPGVPFAGSVVELSCDHDFEMYLLWKPAGNGIYVPLRMCPWGWSGHAILTNGSWILTGSNITTGSDHDETTHPTWFRNVNQNQLVPE